MAAADPLDGQPGALGCTVFANRLRGVLRAAWREAAMLTQEWAERHLVGPDQEQQDLFHGLYFTGQGARRLRPWLKKTCRGLKVRL